MAAILLRLKEVIQLIGNRFALAETSYKILNQLIVLTDANDIQRWYCKEFYVF